MCVCVCVCVCVCLCSCVVWMDEHLVLGGESGDLHVWEAQTLREVSIHKAHSGLYALYCTCQLCMCTVCVCVCVCVYGLHRSSDMSTLVRGWVSAGVWQQGQVCGSVAGLSQTVHIMTHWGPCLGV